VNLISNSEQLIPTLTLIRTTLSPTAKRQHIVLGADVPRAPAPRSPAQQPCFHKDNKDAESHGRNRSVNTCSGRGQPFYMDIVRNNYMGLFISKMSPNSRQCKRDHADRLIIALWEQRQPQGLHGVQ